MKSSELTVGSTISRCSGGEPQLLFRTRERRERWKLSLTAGSVHGLSLSRKLTLVQQKMVCKHKENALPYFQQ